MAALDTPRASVFGAPVRLTGLTGLFASRFVEWRDRHATQIALSKLSDHELYDIGLNRGDINDLKR